jgi:hypothetical protein
MKTLEVMSAWRKILKGEQPSLSIEITRECPLRCPGCYAYGDNHLGGEVTLRGLRDFKGQELVDGVVECVDALQPLHVSLVGGDPMVRHRELEVLVPELSGRGIYVQVVTSAFRPLPFVSEGILFPCQTIFSGGHGLQLFSRSLTVGGYHCATVIRHFSSLRNAGSW